MLVVGFEIQIELAYQVYRRYIARYFLMYSCYLLAYSDNLVSAPLLRINGAGVAEAGYYADWRRLYIICVIGHSIS